MRRKTSVSTLLLTLFIFSLSCTSLLYASEWQTVVGGDNYSTTGVLTGARTHSQSRDKENGVGLVVVTVPSQGSFPIGTAWLYRPDLLATNAHVAYAVNRTLNVCREKRVKGCVPYYLPNKTKGQSIQIIKMAVHPDYNQIPVNMNGSSAASSPDVALMRLKKKLSSPLSVASKTVLENLQPGDSIQYIGFPMERLLGHNINIHDVMAITQSGTVSAISDWWFGDSGRAANKLIRHDLGVAGGASGSPIFNKDGQVIGLVNAGNMTGSISVNKKGKLQIHRTPNATMVNFGVRADLLNDINI